MAKKEIKTDFWVYGLLQEAGLNLTPQGCDIKEVDEALKTASKAQTGNVGYPEYCGIVKDFLLVIEDKATLEKHIVRNDKKLISQDVKSVKDYAVNGALFYGLHLAAHTSFHKVLAFGVSGNEKRHRITPIFINERGDYQELSDVETFISFNENNIDEFYLKEILKEETDVEKTTAEILKDAEKLHNDLRNYGNLTTEQKPLIVSGIMLALREIEYKTFSIDSLIGDNVKILAGSIIKHAIIGNNSIIRENTVIGNSAYTIVNDDNGNSMRMPDLGRVIIGDNVEIGALTGVERGSAGDTIIEDYVKIDMHVVIGHDSVIHKNCHIIAGAVIAGFVTVGENSFVGLNAAIKNRTNIGENVIIGMGATVLKDASNNTTIVGNPGRELVKKK